MESPHLPLVLLLLRGLLSAGQGPLRCAAAEAPVATLDGDEVLPTTWFGEHDIQAGFCGILVGF